jgi:hypothetical protein
LGTSLKSSMTKYFSVPLATCVAKTHTAERGRPLPKLRLVESLTDFLLQIMRLDCDTFFPSSLNLLFHGDKSMSTERITNSLESRFWYD